MLSIIQLAKLLNLYTRERLFFESFVIDKYKCVIRFADQEDATLVYFKFDKSFQDMIYPWTGAIVDIPEDWVLCDGTKGTPDLRDRFIVNPEFWFAVDETGGSVNHTHTFTGNGHFHFTNPGTNFTAGPDLLIITDTKNVSGTSDPANILPPYYALAFVMNKGWAV